MLRKVLADVKEHGTSLNYLLQHSAGSGKTNEIAWLSHRLASLHDADNKIIFDRIISKLKNIKEVNVLDVEHMTKKIIKTGTEEVTIEYYYTEITSEGVNKWNAISRLIDILNISKEEVITIGDNANDIMMIKEAGMGVIMGNAAPYLKDSANFETKTNNEDGVAEALEKLILE